MNMFAIYRWGDAQYKLDEVDVFWLAKSLWGECGKNASNEDMLAVSSCMMQRYLRWPKAQLRWPSFMSFVRAFSQPVNPLWSSPSVDRRAKYPRLCSATRLKRRRRIRDAAWVDVPQRAKKLALAFACGVFDSPCPDAVNFGAEGLIRRQKKSGINIGGNVFIDESQDKGIKWLPGSLEIIV